MRILCDLTSRLADFGISKSDIRDLYDDIFIPQGIDINHNVKWSAGDKIINGISNFFSSKDDDSTTYQSAYSADDKENQTFLKQCFATCANLTLPSSLFVMSLLLMQNRSNKFTKGLFFVSLSILLLYVIYEADDTLLGTLLPQFLPVWLKHAETNDFTDEPMEMEEVDPQGLPEDISIYGSMLATVINGAVGYKAKGRLIDALFSITKCTENQSKNINFTLIYISTQIGDFFSKVLNQDTIAEYFYIDTITDLKVKDFLDKVGKFIAIMNAGSPSSNAYCGEVYETYTKEGAKIILTLDKMSYEYRAVMSACLKLSNLKQTMDNLKTSLNGDRIEPVGVLIKGKPGCFKSILMSRIGTVVARKTIPLEWSEDFKSSPKDFHYTVPNDKFYDGYTNKAWISYIDDVFQRRDSVGDENADAIKIIKMINTAPYVLPMAESSSKNNSFFRSAFVFATTNLARWDSIESVHDYKAVERRFNVELDISVSPKYVAADGISIDENLLPNVSVLIDDLELKDCSQIPNDFWTINLVTKKANSKSESRTVTLLEVIKIIIEQHYERVKHFYVNKQFNSNLADQLSDELDREFSKSGLFGKLCSSTMTPQSGLSDEPFVFAITKYIEDLEHSRYMIYDEYFYAMCQDLKRMDIYRIGLRTFLLRYFEHPCNQSRELLDLIPDCAEFFIKLHYLIGLRVHNNANIYDLTEEYDFLYDETISSRTCLTKCKSFFMAICHFVKDNVKYILIGGVIIGPIIYWASGFFKSVISPMAQSVDMSRLGKRVGVKHVIKLSDGRSKINVKPQGYTMIDVDFTALPKFTSLDFGERNNNNDIVAKVFNKYFFIVYLLTPDKSGGYEVIRMGHSINVKGQLFLIPFHFIYQLYAHTNKPGYTGSQIVLSTTTQSNRYNLTLEDFLAGFRTTDQASDNDICLVEIKVAQKMSAGIIQYVLRERDLMELGRITTFPATIAGSYIHQLGKPNLSLRLNRTHAKLTTDPVVVNATWDDENPHYKLFNTIRYRSTFSNGDCGSLLMCDTSNYENRIIAGIHVAGDKVNGFSTRLSQENLNELIDSSFGPIDCFIDEEEPDYMITNLDLLCQSGIVPVASLKASHTPAEVFCSDLQKSSLFGKLPEPWNKVGFYPAKLKKFLKDGVEIDPMRLALNKYGKLPTTIPLSFIDEAVKSYENLIRTNSPYLAEGKVVIGTRDALHSFDGVNSISSSTSAGFPMTLPGHQNLKKEYFKAIRDNDNMAATSVYLRIAESVDKCVELYMKKVRPYWAYKDCLKDETVSFEKSKIGKTRMFSGSPFILLVLFRKYFGKFIDMYTSANIDVGSAIGINPYSTDWNRLGINLCKFSRNPKTPDKGAGDFSGYDTTEFASILNRILDIIISWYGKGNDIDNYIRTCLWSEITNSRHVAYGNVYEWFSGMPSGNPMTAIINTMYNNIVFRVAFQFANLDITKFNSLVYLCCLGDDNVFSTHPSIRDIFNEMTLPGYMSSCGMKYTTELKETALVPARAMHEIEFLKRSFNFDKRLNRWVAPLREEAICEMLNWTKKGLKGDQITVDNMVMAVREFALHGRKKFNYWKQHLLDLKTEFLHHVDPHTDFEIEFESAYHKVLTLEYLF